MVKKLLLILILALAGSGVRAMNDDSDAVDPEDTPRRWIYKSVELPRAKEPQETRPVELQEFQVRAFQKAIEGLETEFTKLKFIKAAQKQPLVAQIAQNQQVGRLKSLTNWIVNHQKTVFLATLLGYYAGSYIYDYVGNTLVSPLLQEDWMHTLCTAANASCQANYAILSSLCPQIMSTCSNYLPVQSPSTNGWFW